MMLRYQAWILIDLCPVEGICIVYTPRLPQRIVNNHQVVWHNNGLSVKVSQLIASIVATHLTIERKVGLSVIESIPKNPQPGIQVNCCAIHCKNSVPPSTTSPRLCKNSGLMHIV